MLHLARALLLAEAVTPEILAEALVVAATQGTNLPRSLIAAHAIDTARLEEFFEHYHEGSSAPLLVKVTPLRELAASLPAGLCERLQAVPVRRDPLTGTVDVAVVDARDSHASREVAHFLKAPVRTVRTSLAAMEAALVQVHAERVRGLRALAPPMGVGGGAGAAGPFAASTPSEREGGARTPSAPPDGEVAIPLTRRNTQSMGVAAPAPRPQAPRIQPSDPEPQIRVGVTVPEAEPVLDLRKRKTAAPLTVRGPFTAEAPPWPARPEAAPAHPEAGPTTTATMAAAPVRPTATIENAAQGTGAAEGPARPPTALTTRAPTPATARAPMVATPATTRAPIPAAATPSRAPAFTSPRPATGSLAPARAPSLAPARAPSLAPARAPSLAPPRTPTHPPPRPAVTDTRSVLADMATASDRDRILELLVEGARGVAGQVAVLAVRKDALTGWACSPEFANRDAMRGVKLSNAAPTVLHEALEHAGSRLARLPKDERHAPLLAVMDSTPPSEVALVAVHAAGKPVAIVLAHELVDMRESQERIVELARGAGAALERLLRERRK